MTTAKIITPPRLLRLTAVIVVVTGNIISLGFTLHTGHNNRSVFLIMLFLGWVSSPFIGLLVACLASSRWPVSTCKILYILMILIAIGSVVGYSGVFSSAGMKPAFVFLVIPLLSWVLIAITIPVAIAKARKMKSLQSK